MGTLLGSRLVTFMKSVYVYTEGQIISNLGNETWCDAHRFECGALRDVMHMGLEVALNLNVADWYRETEACASTA